MPAWPPDSAAEPRSAQGMDNDQVMARHGRDKNRPAARRGQHRLGSLSHCGHPAWLHYHQVDVAAVQQDWRGSVAPWC